MAQIEAIVERGQEWLDPGRSSSRPRCEMDPPASVPKLNDHVYEVHKPSGRPAVELVFIHGIQREDCSREPHLKTWSVRGNDDELWLTWLLEPFPDARILTVYYDAALKKTDSQGNMDVFRISENLVTCLRLAKVGQDGCPVILVGHCIGGLVIKEVLRIAESNKQCDVTQKFIDGVRGIFFYATPHQGAELPVDYQKGSLFEYLECLNKSTARLNDAFSKLRIRLEKRCTTAAVGEGQVTNMGSFKGLIVPEASARYDSDGLFYTIIADHFDICRPSDKECTGFQKLRDFIETSLREDRGRQVPKKIMQKYTVGVEPVVDSIRHSLNRGNGRLAIVGMGGIGKTTLAKVLYDTIGANFDYTCFVNDVKGKMGNDYSEQKLQRLVTENLICKGRKVEDGFQWSMLQAKRVLIILDDVDKKEHVMILNGVDQFSKQSCFITTSRDKHRFLVQHAFEFHQMGCLNSSYAEMLLCWHAFQQEVAPPNIQKWVKLLVEKCGNLPLALEVVGGHLLKRADNEKLWEGAYKKIKEAKCVDGSSEDSLWSILEWSFDTLCSDEQNMFLDIATIFHGKELGWANPLWDGYLSSRELTWQNLADKCLVSLGGSWGFTISMHELYRDLGRRKANPDPTDVTTHTRVFEEDRFSELLEKEEDGAVKVLWYSWKWKFPSKRQWDMRRWI